MKNYMPLADTATAVSDALSAATALFGVMVTLALLVTGFAVGRRWLARAGMDDGGGKDYIISDGKDGQLVGNMSEDEAQQMRDRGHFATEVSKYRAAGGRHVA